MLIETRGLAFDVTVGGPADGEPVLLLHGFPQRAAMWAGVTPALHAAGLRTIAPDQRGYSAGARPEQVEAYRLTECAADALAIAAAVTGGGPVHLVGHDWGALVGWLLAARQPDLVRSYTAVSIPHPEAVAKAVRDHEDQRVRLGYIDLFRTSGKAEQVLLAEGAQRLRAMFAGSDLDPTGVDRYVRPLLEPGALTGALNWYRANDLARTGALGPVEVPTTYLWGEHDIAIGPDAAYGCAGYVRGDYRFVPLPELSHWLPDQAPDVVAREIVLRITGKE